MAKREPLARKYLPAFPARLESQAGMSPLLPLPTIKNTVLSSWKKQKIFSSRPFSPRHLRRVADSIQ
jgi:hypothetical protein